MLEGEFRIDRYDKVSLKKLLDQMRSRHLGGYDGLLKDFVGALAAYAQQTGSNKPRHSDGPQFVVGLSGGVDSSVVLAITVRAVGTSGVHPVTMPAYWDDTSVRQGADVRRFLGFQEREIPYEIRLDGLVEQYAQMTCVSRIDGFGIPADIDERDGVQKIRAGNFAARLRVSILYDLARALDARVLGTGSRAEWMQGHAAKYGTPFSCDLGVLGSLYKVDVYELAGLLSLPEAILTAVPGTGYYPGHTHEDELGLPVELQDGLVYLLFDEETSVADTAAYLDIEEELIAEFAERCRRAEHKRICKPPFLDIGPVAPPQDSP